MRLSDEDDLYICCRLNIWLLARFYMWRKFMASMSFIVTSL